MLRDQGIGLDFRKIYAEKKYGTLRVSENFLSDVCRHLSSETPKFYYDFDHEALRKHKNLIELHFSLTYLVYLITNIETFI